MTNKDNLHKELKEKIKQGIKPSDLKKKKVKPESKEDEGYESEEESIIVPTVPTPPPLPNQEIKNLQTKITALERQLQTYKDFKEADLKIKEKYKEEIKEKDQIITKHEQSINNLQTKIQEQYKTISELKNQEKNTIKDKGEVKEPVNKTFFCDSCQLTKTGTITKRTADCPFEPRLHGRVVYLCSSCSPYIKELNDTTFDPDNNPYKIY